MCRRNLRETFLRTREKVVPPPKFLTGLVGVQLSAANQ